MTDSTSMPMCPMAATCKSMMEKPHSGFMLVIPGLVFIILGVAVLAQPRIVVWLVAAALIAMGVGMVLMAKFMSNFGQRTHGIHG